MSLRSGHGDTTPFLTQADNTEEQRDRFPEHHVSEDEEDDGSGGREVELVTGISYRHSVVIVMILFYVNLLNYMDRFTVAGVLPAIKTDFVIEDSDSGLVQTVFICSYMVLAPVFGYLGDRYNRKYIMCGGISFWSLVTLGSSFIPKQVTSRMSSSVTVCKSLSPKCGELLYQGFPGWDYRAELVQ
ncbi:hypothetical protein FKM82_002649 [Ascaphus truei]